MGHPNVTPIFASDGASNTPIEAVKHANLMVERRGGVIIDVGNQRDRARGRSERGRRAGRVIRYWKQSRNVLKWISWIPLNPSKYP